MSKTFTTMVEQCLGNALDFVEGEYTRRAENVSLILDAWISTDIDLVVIQNPTIEAAVEQCRTAAITKYNLLWLMRTCPKTVQASIASISVRPLPLQAEGGTVASLLCAIGDCEDLYALSQFVSRLLDALEGSEWDPKVSTPPKPPPPLDGRTVSQTEHDPDFDLSDDKPRNEPVDDSSVGEVASGPAEPV